MTVPVPEEQAAESYAVALSLLAAGLSGDTALADLIWETTQDKRELFIALACIAATALREAGADPAQWVAGLQAAQRARLAGG